MGSVVEGSTVVVTISVVVWMFVVVSTGFLEVAPVVKGAVVFMLF